MKHDVKVGPCPSCGSEVMELRDVDTREPLLVDLGRVDEGDVEVYRVGPLLVCRPLGKPARGQPAHRLHTCTTGPQPAPADPYTDDDPGLEQARWRAP